MAEDRQTGQVVWFNNTKGYGFIRKDTGGEIFVHYSGIDGVGFKSLQEGEKVSFEEIEGNKGPQASNVRKELGD